jgi:tRNA(adenine34) deaminase
MDTPRHRQQTFMKRAISIARKFGEVGHYPIGAVVVDARGKILSVGYTSVTVARDPTAHGEINAIKSACKTSGNRFIQGCWLYTTLEPCAMCTSAAIWARMDGIVFGASYLDVPNFQHRSKRADPSWHQITISSRYIIEHSPQTVVLMENFMRPICKSLITNAV